MIGWETDDTDPISTSTLRITRLASRRDPKNGNPTYFRRGKGGTSTQDSTDTDTGGETLLFLFSFTGHFSLRLLQFPLQIYSNRRTLGQSVDRKSVLKTIVLDSCWGQNEFDWPKHKDRVCWFWYNYLRSERTEGSTTHQVMGTTRSLGENSTHKDKCLQLLVLVQLKGSWVTTRSMTRLEENL